MDIELTASEKIEAVYNMEINAGISWFWDSGFVVSLGDSVNGYDAQTDFDTFEKAVDWLYLEAVKKIVNRK